MGRHVRGATLLEVIVVVGIAATLISLVWRSEALASRLALRGAAVTLLSDLRTAQARAMAEHRSDRAYGVEFLLGDNRYVLFTQEGPVKVPIREQRLPGRVRITYARFGGGTPAAVMFTGISLLGAPSGGGTVTLASGSARVCVRVLPATGRVRVANTNCP